MPRPLIEQIADMCNKVMAEPFIRAHFAALSAEPIGLGPTAAREQMEREMKTFAELATAMGIRQQ
ncbi:MAG: hypothetical protein JNK84_10825 [Phreatobacter sp.]|uniref:hypothetical protein n=1 Tax=Phreatobacter sp. TaxID=1966341 RepID=UPI001A5F7A02|nr:hypothetical protein [Phreatobacter sp.]MBL8569566.1 hypothetical protein [Phreatobacter sp.]